MSRVNVFQLCYWPCAKTGYGSPVSSVTFADVLADKYLELFVSDMRNGKVLMALPFEKDPAMYVIASISHPAAITAVDFDNDKKNDFS